MKRLKFNAFFVVGIVVVVLISVVGYNTTSIADSIKPTADTEGKTEMVETKKPSEDPSLKEEVDPQIDEDSDEDVESKTDEVGG